MMSGEPNLEFKFKLLYQTIGRPYCKYFAGDERMCLLSENYRSDDEEEMQWHIALNCYGDINICDLPEKFRHLVRNIE